VAAVRVSLLVTCTVDLLEPEVGEATVRVLRAAGCEVTVALGQTCCGQPGWNAGHVTEAAKVARTTLTALEAELADGAEWVVVPAGSCATMVRVFWPELFELVGDHATADRARRVGERTRELSELLDDLDLPPMSVPDTRVGYHHSCHMLRELRIRAAPEHLVDRVDGVERVAWDGDDRCCGFGGLFSVKLPELSAAMADEKLAALADAGVDEVVGCDASCLAQMRTRSAAVGAPVRTRHLAQLLADALPEGRGPTGPAAAP
jgi:L-lactate dehydrogenase complex protein LldE